MKLSSHAVIQLERSLYAVRGEPLFDSYLLERSVERRMPTVVAPIGIEYLEFGLVWVATLKAEVSHYFSKVVGIHSEAVFFAITSQVVVL